MAQFVRKYEGSTLANSKILVVYEVSTSKNSVFGLREAFGNLLLFLTALENTRRGNKVTGMYWVILQPFATLPFQLQPAPLRPQVLYLGVLYKALNNIKPLNPMTVVASSSTFSSNISEMGILEVRLHRTLALPSTAVEKSIRLLLFSQVFAVFYFRLNHNDGKWKAEASRI